MCTTVISTKSVVAKIGLIVTVGNVYANPDGRANDVTVLPARRHALLQTMTVFALGMVRANAANANVAKSIMVLFAKQVHLFQVHCVRIMSRVCVACWNKKLELNAQT